MRFFRIFLFLSILLFTAQILFAAKAQWPMIRQNCRNTATTNMNIIGVQGNPAVKWKCNLNDRPFEFTNPVVSPDNSYVYITTWAHNNNTGPPWYGVFFAISTTNTSTNIVPYYSINSTYLIGEFLSLDSAGNIYVADQASEYLQQGTLYAIKKNSNTFSKSNIFSAKKFNAGGALIGPTGTLYIGNCNGCFYSITSGVTNTIFSTGYTNETWVIPAMGSDGKIYTGTTRTSNIYALSNGSQIWTRKFGKLPTSPLIVDDNNNIYFGCSDGSLVSFRPDGRTNWISKIANNAIDSAPSIYNGVVYFGSDDKKLYAVNVADGSPKSYSSFSAADSIKSSPIITSDGMIYFSTTPSSYLYSITTNFQLRWNMYFPINNQESTPTIGPDGTLYFGNGHESSSGYLYAIVQGPTPPPTWKSLRGTSKNSVSLSWNNTGNITSQTLYRSTSPYTNGGDIITAYAFSNSSVTSYTDKLLDPNKQYYYWLKTYFNGKTSSFSSMGSAKTWIYDKAPWPMLRQNIRHTGQTNMIIRGVRGNPVLKWAHTTVNYISYSSPAIGQDGTAYICSENQLYAIANNSKKWSFSSTSPAYSSPAIGPDGTVYFGSEDKNLYAITNGQVKWSFATMGQIASSPTIGPDGTVYIGSLDKKLYAITNGAIKWTNRTGDAIYSTPTIGSDGTIYVGSHDHKLYAITNGVIKWTNRTYGWVDSSPAIGPDGTVYVGSCDKNLYAITNGKVKWLYPTGGEIYSSPAIGPDGTIYVGSYDNKLHAITNGAMKWSYTTGSNIYSTPTLGSDGTVYIGDADKKIYAITNGALKWSYLTGDSIESSPAIGPDGTLFIGCRDRNLYAIGEGALQPIVSTTAIATNKISISWSPVPNNNITSFTLFCSTNSSTNSTISNRIRGFSSLETSYTVTNLLKYKKYYFILRAYNSLAPSLLMNSIISNYTLSDKPSAPTLHTPEVLSSTALQITWQHMVNLSSWSLFRNTTASTSGLIPLGSFSSNSTNFVSISLNPNTRYYYFLKACNLMGSSPFSSPVSNTTLAGPALLSFNPGLFYVGIATNFIVTNKKQIGQGFMKGYLYQWDMITNTPSVYAKSWTNGISLNAYRTNVATNEGAWYLHIISVNNEGLLSYPKLYGPFYYFSQIVAGIRIKTDHDMINNNGTDCATISTAVPISNAASPYGHISVTNKFYIRILEGKCDITCSGTNNGLQYVKSNPSNISFKVSGTVINKVTLQVYWEADASKSDIVSFLISPPMDLDAQHPVVIYNNILNPDKGDKLNIYIIAQQDEKVEVKIYDIMERRLILDKPTNPGTMRNFEWDLKLDNGKAIPDKFYGVLVKGQSWKREMKFVVKRK